jgi:hypothetical protein
MRVFAGILAASLAGATTLILLTFFGVAIPIWILEAIRDPSDHRFPVDSVVPIANEQVLSKIDAYLANIGVQFREGEFPVAPP